jgi:hypothetical protein
MCKTLGEAESKQQQRIPGPEICKTAVSSSDAVTVFEWMDHGVVCHPTISQATSPTGMCGLITNIGNILDAQQNGQLVCWSRCIEVRSDDQIRIGRDGSHTLSIPITSPPPTISTQPHEQQSKGMS